MSDLDLLEDLPDELRQTFFDTLSNGDWDLLTNAEKFRVRMVLTVLGDIAHSGEVESLAASDLSHVRAMTTRIAARIVERGQAEIASRIVVGVKTVAKAVARTLLEAALAAIFDDFNDRLDSEAWL